MDVLEIAPSKTIEQLLLTDKYDIVLGYYEEMTDEHKASIAKLFSLICEYYSQKTLPANVKEEFENRFPFRWMRMHFNDSPELAKTYFLHANT
jgi:hypothetical protein